MTFPFVLIFIISIAVPTLAAVFISIHDIFLQRIRLTQHAPRKRAAATVLIFHTDTDATLRSVRQLRRMRAVRLSIIIVVPAGARLNTTVPNVKIYRKRSSASRQLTLASAYPLINPTLPLLVIDGGDIVSAAAIHGAMQRLRTQPRLTYILTRRIAPLDVSFLGILVWFSAILRHGRFSLRASGWRALPAGVWLRSGRLLQRTSGEQHGSYLPQLATTATASALLPELTFQPALYACTYIAVAIYCHVIALSAGTTLPVITFWVVSAWWLFTLLAISHARYRDQLTAASVVPLAGIILPAWHLVILGNTLLRRLRQNLTRTRRQHPEHGIFFRLSHP